MYKMIYIIVAINSCSRSCQSAGMVFCLSVTFVQNPQTRVNISESCISGNHAQMVLVKKIEKNKNVEEVPS